MFQINDATCIDDGCHEQPVPGRSRCRRHVEYHRVHNAKYYKNNKTKVEARRRAWCRANPDHLWAWHIKKKFGVTPERYQHMLDTQGGGCAICKTTEPGGQAGKYGRFHIDHNHNTGKVRGLLCNNCNVAMGGFKDSADLLDAAAAYLRSTDRPEETYRSPADVAN